MDFVIAHNSAHRCHFFTPTGTWFSRTEQMEHGKLMLTNRSKCNQSSGIPVYTLKLNPLKFGKRKIISSQTKHVITYPSWYQTYRQVSDIRRTSIGNLIVDHSDVDGASPVGAAPTTSSFSTWYLASKYCAKTTGRRDDKHISFGIWCALY